MLERREILGGACVTEEVWPGKRVSRASYVVSMLQPKVVADLALARFGYRAIPLDPAYVALTEHGPIFFFNEAAGTAASIARQSQADADAYEPFEDLMFRAAKFVRPMMLQAPPALGSHAPADLAALLREAGRIGGISKRDIHELVRMFTMSVGDLLDDYFELDGLKGSIASTGVVGVWAGPRTPGTAYNLLHHALGELDGIEGAWGQVIGGMGAISEAIAAPRSPPAPRSAPAPRSPRSTSRTGGPPASRSPTATSSARRSSPRARTPRRPSSTSPAPRTSPTRSPTTCAATAPAAARSRSTWCSASPRATRTSARTSSS